MDPFPDVSRDHRGCVREMPIGKGDYIIGGGRGLPFVSFDGPSKRRPLIVGEVLTDLSGYPSEAASMFAGREHDPVEWAVMWKELGMDAVCIHSDDPSEAASVAVAVSARTSLPIVLRGGREVFDAVADAVVGTRLVFLGEGPDGHVSAVPYGHTEGRDDRAILITTEYGLGDAVSSIRRIRADALEGHGDSSPIICDVASSWSSERDPRVDFTHQATWTEALAALAAMTAGADMIIIKGAASADMAKVYAEELAEVPL
jgi:CO dehydrogenase/acetyl-CoA synthase delta subunit